MLTIEQNMKWYIQTRHDFLAKPLVQNYAVYVQSIPPQYQTEPQLRGFFCDCFSRENIIDVSLFARGTSGIEQRLPNLQASGQEDKSSTSHKIYGCDGFVVFKTLKSRNTALQTINHATPFEMKVLEAPHPTDVRWNNIGRSRNIVLLRKWGSVFASIFLCLASTAQISFFASLWNAAAVQKDFMFLDGQFEKFSGMAPVIARLSPGLAAKIDAIRAKCHKMLQDFPGSISDMQLLKQIAPLQLVIMNAFISKLLIRFCWWERPISSQHAESSVIARLSLFVVFLSFVSAICGCLYQGISGIIEKQDGVLFLIGNTLPMQATYFIQIIFLTTIVNATCELLRVIPLSLATLLHWIKPSFRKNEQRKSHAWLRSLLDPAPFNYAVLSSQITLFLMVLFTFAVMAPCGCFVAGICFLAMNILLKHQFVNIYPKSSSLGGQVLFQSIRITLGCILFSQGE